MHPHPGGWVSAVRPAAGSGGGCDDLLGVGGGTVWSFGVGT
jgi:hypothetical protein